MGKAITWISRILVGALFIFSGFIKANDPDGFAYKLEEYFNVFGTQFLSPISIYISILACILEVFVGIMLLIGLWRNFTTWLLLFMILFFSFLTFYSAYFEVVQDCGCFGDFLKLTPWESFGKNAILLALILILFLNKTYIEPAFKESIAQKVALGALALAIIFPVYTYSYLPVWDFRPYKEGNNIYELMQVPEDAPEDKYKTTFIYKNKESGETKEFTTDNIPSDDEWKWQETNNKLVQKGYTPPIHDFSITGPDGYEYTQDFLDQESYRILVVQYDLTKSNGSAQKEINQLAKAIKGKQDMGFWALTASSDEELKEYREAHNVKYPIYFTDATTLKTIIRANPGVLLMKGNVVKQKWSSHSVPNMEDLRSYLQ